MSRGFVALACAVAAAAAHAAGWNTLGGNAQHTGVSATPAQPMSVLHWSTPVDLTSPGGTILIHYGSPVITPANTVVIPIRTTAADTFRLDARKGGDGTLLWSAGTDYLLPPHSWKPSYSPALGAGGRVHYAGAGGTVLFRDVPDAAVPVNSGRVAFYGLPAWQSNSAAYNAKVFVNTPITAGANGAIYFGFRALAGAPGGLASGIARIDAGGNGTWASASAIAGDPAATIVPHQAAPALANDEGTLYVVVASESSGGNSWVVGLDPATLLRKEIAPGVPMRVALKDPRNGGVDNAIVTDNSSASPMVGPDGDVYYGVLGNPFNGSRGWLLHFSGNLAVKKTPGAFGWDSTAAVVPAAAVPSYTGGSSYLVFSKYNNYAGYDGGNGVNRIAILDPNDTMVEPHASSGGLPVMKEVLAIAGVTPDPDYAPFYPGAVREWCINAAAVDPVTKAVIANSEDGKVYRWDLTTNTLSEAVTLSPGIGEAYTSTLIGPDGTVYATNWAILNAVGQVNPAPLPAGAVSRKMHGNPGPTFDVALSPTPATPTIEPRSGGAGNQHSVVFTFDKPVNGGTASIAAGTATAGTPTFNGNEMTVPIHGVTDAQYVTVAVSSVASADGGRGGAARVRIGFLVGDVNGSGGVSLTDLLQVNAVQAQTATGGNFLRDVNASGSISVADKLIVNANLTRVLPPP